MGLTTNPRSIQQLKPKSTAAADIGKEWADASLLAMTDRQSMSGSVQSLPPVRVCTPPARGEGAMLRGNYTSSSSEVSLDRTPRDHSTTLGGGQHAAAHHLMHWHSAPTEDPGHLRPTASDAQQAQAGHPRCAPVHLETPQHSPRSACRSTSGSAAAASCPLCPDSEARLAAARHAVVDLMQRLTDATEERDEALEAAQREWRLAELLRQELAATPDHPQAQAASSCGRPSGGLRSSRIPDADSPGRFDADWQAARRDLAAAADAFRSPRSSVTPQQHWRRHSLEAAAAADAASEVYYTPAQHLLPAQHSTSPLQECHSSGGKRRSPVHRQLLMDGHRLSDSAAVADGAAGPWLLQTPYSGSPPAAAHTFSAFSEPEQQMHSAQLAAAEARAKDLEHKLSSAGSFIARLLTPQGSTFVADGHAADGLRRSYSNAEGPAAAAADADGLLQRLRALATEAADVSRPADDGAAPSHSSSSRSRRLNTQQQQQSRCSRLSTSSRELPAWLPMPDAAAADAAPAEPGSDYPDVCVTSDVGSQRRPGSPLTAMQEAVQQMGAVARRVRAATQNPAGVHPAAAAPPGCSSAAPSSHCSGQRSGCSATGLGGPTAAHVALNHARMDMEAATQALATRSAEALRLLSPCEPPLLGC